MARGIEHGPPRRLPRRLDRGRGAKQTAHPRASFVAPDGTLVGPAVIHTPKEVDARARELRAESQVVAHDLAGTRAR